MNAKQQLLRAMKTAWDNYTDKCDEAIEEYKEATAELLNQYDELKAVARKEA